MDTLWQIPSLGGEPGHAWLGVSFLQDWDMTNMTNIINITPDREICIKFASHSTAAWQTNHLELRADCRTGQITPVSMLHQLEIVWVYLTLGCSCNTYWAQNHLICWLAPENRVKIFLTITATAPRAQTIFSELSLLRSSVSGCSCSSFGEIIMWDDGSRAGPGRQAGHYPVCRDKEISQITSLVLTSGQHFSENTNLGQNILKTWEKVLPRPDTRCKWTALMIVPPLTLRWH